MSLGRFVLQLRRCEFISVIHSIRLASNCQFLPSNLTILPTKLPGGDHEAGVIKCHFENRSETNNKYNDQMIVIKYFPRNISDQKSNLRQFENDLDPQYFNLRKSLNVKFDLKDARREFCLCFSWNSLRD